MKKTNQYNKEIENEYKHWNMKYAPKITELDLEEMYKEHLKNHPDHQVKGDE